MPVDMDALRAELESAEQELLAYRTDYFVQSKRSPFARDAERLALLRHGPADCSVRQPVVQCYNCEPTVGSNHLMIEKPRREDALLARGARIAELIAGSPAFARDDLCVAITLRPGNSRTRIEMSIDNLLAHPAPVLLPSLIKSLGWKLEQLEAVTPGKNATWLVREQAIYAPDAGTALLKHALFREPEILEKLDDGIWPVVARIYDESQVVAEFNALRRSK